MAVGDNGTGFRGKAPAGPGTAPRRRFGVSMATALALTLGGLVFAAVATVLGLVLVSAQQNTFGLLGDKASLTIASAVAEIRAQLDPARSQVVFLRDVIASGRLDPADTGRLLDLLTGSLAATPQIGAVTFIYPDDRIVGVRQTRQGEILPVETRAIQPHVLDSLREIRASDAPQWGEHIYAPNENVRQAMSLSAAVRRGSEFVGWISVNVSIVRLSQFLDEISNDFGNNAFILRGETEVLAHRSLARSYRGPSAEKILPGIGAVGDPVLAAIWSAGGPDEVPRISERVLQGDVPDGAEAPFRAHTVDVGDEGYLFVYQWLDDFGPVPWLVGSYFPAADVAGEIRRLVEAAAAGVLVLIVAVIAAVIMGRLVVRPIRRLASAANRVSEFDLESVEDLPGSPIRELDDQSRAFNSMLTGLNWFATYVPRALVQRLVDSGKAGQVASEMRNLTVMFTDITGFTAISETLDADAVAGLLNQHFAIVVAAVEAEGGTIDKYIGDSVMAFWGAPEQQDDHGARAARAALALGRAIESENEDRHHRGAAAIRIRVGIHTGDVVVGNIGAPGRVNYTIVGDTVNTGSRLEQLGKDLGGDAEVTILVSAETVRQMGEGFTVESLGRQSLRGRGAEIEAFRLL